MSENRLKPISIDSESDVKETTFSENSVSITTKGQLNDAKMEKKVTFARLLSKVSAEISSGSEVKFTNFRLLCSFQCVLHALNSALLKERK